MFSLFTAAALCAAEIDVVEPTWNPPAEYPEILRDIASRLPRDTVAKHEDLITYTHEGAHMLAATRNGRHALYQRNGLRVWIQQPPVRMDEVERMVPLEWRGKVFATYMHQGKHLGWINQPIILVDEWLAYYYGSIARQQMRCVKRQESDRFCAELACYSMVMYQMAKRTDYDITDLRDFCRQLLQKCKADIPNWECLPANVACGGVQFE